MNAYSLHHIGIATASIAEAVPLYERLTGNSGSPVEELPHQGVNVAFVGQVELLEPTGDDSPIGRFLDRRGPGLHHLAYRVPDLVAELSRLRDMGMRLIDESPRPGAGGHQAAFIHPESAGGVLWELVQE